MNAELVRKWTDKYAILENMFSEDGQRDWQNYQIFRTYLKNKHTIFSVQGGCVLWGVHVVTQEVKIFFFFFYQ